MPASDLEPGLAVYFHWPFCASKCPYCDFNSHVAAGAVDHERWRRALLAELSHYAEETKGRAVSSVFFGGGTPSLMEPATVAELIAAVRSHWQTDEDLEITLEANPSSAEAGRFRDFRAAGVNRLSLGVQSFQDDSLAFLGRRHSSAEARKAIAMAAEHFDRFSFDMMYGLPDQSPEDWRRDLEETLELAGDHLSLYQLTIEPGTAFYSDGVKATGEDTGAELFHITQDVLEGAGLAAYEVSNHARPGAESRHNLNIWRGGDYIGVGPGAHGRLTKDFLAEALHQIHAPGRWLQKTEDGGHGTAKRRPLSPEIRSEEILMMGLRLTEGISRDRFAAVTGHDLDGAVGRDGLRRMVEGGFVEADEAGLRVTSAGRLCLNEVLRQLLAGD
ncbi:MAG: coproporphyrinogen III oxidase [Proteobacteria bacterium]|nr:coproporphyrinogen III oxidase [Pseudomonadota bacterium]